MSFTFDAPRALAEIAAAAGRPAKPANAATDARIVAGVAGLAAPDLDAFEERATIAGHDGGIARHAAEAPAAREAGHANASSLFTETVRHWRAQLTHLAEQSTTDLRGPGHIAAAIRFADEGWAETALALGWLEVELVGLCPRAPWHRLDRMGAAYGLHEVRAVTADAVHYGNGLIRRRGLVNTDRGAALPWEATSPPSR